MAYKDIFIKPFFELAPVRRTKTELFSETVKREAKKASLDYVVNANYYDLSNSGKLSALMGEPADAVETTVQGHVVFDGRLLFGTSRAEDFFISYDKTTFALTKSLSQSVASGRGDPPLKGVGFGGLGPLIIDGLPYGAVNTYKQGAPNDLPVTGEPPLDKKKYLTQRSSRKFAAFAARDREKGGFLGKVCVGFSDAGLHVFVQEDESVGLTLFAIRDKFLQAGCKHAVFFDGSDSAMLYEKGSFVIRQASRKDETCVLGLGVKIKK